MRITRQHLRKIIKETLLLEQDAEGTGTAAVEAFILNDLLEENEEMILEDIIEQSEGAGFDSKEAEEVIAKLLDTGQIVDEDGTITLA
jgi:DNA replicative helicase MCM subunit Mcm2 (Cdc46/Mcm family)